jgi:hypothetical protein
MKFPYPQIILLVHLMMMSRIATAPAANCINIFVSEPVKPFDRLIKAVFMVESSGDTLAYNIKEEAVGGLQIRPIKLLDYNQRTGKNYKMEDCYSYIISKEIFIFYAFLSGTTDYELIARRWNGSGTATFDYWIKVKSLL